MNKVKKFIEDHELEVSLGAITLGSIGFGAILGYVAGYNHHVNTFRKYVPDILKDSMRIGGGAYEDVLRAKVPKVDDLIKAYDLINPGELGGLFAEIIDHEVGEALIEAGIK